MGHCRIRGKVWWSFFGGFLVNKENARNILKN